MRSGLNFENPVFAEEVHNIIRQKAARPIDHGQDIDSIANRFPFLPFLENVSKAVAENML